MSRSAAAGSKIGAGTTVAGGAAGAGAGAAGGADGGIEDRDGVGSGVGVGDCVGSEGGADVGVGVTSGTGVVSGVRIGVVGGVESGVGAGAGVSVLGGSVLGDPVLGDPVLGDSGMSGTALEMAVGVRGIVGQGEVAGAAGGIASEQAGVSPCMTVAVSLARAGCGMPTSASATIAIDTTERARRRPGGAEIERLVR